MDVHLLNDNRIKSTVRRSRRRERNLQPYGTQSLPSFNPSGYQPPVVAQAIDNRRNNAFGIGAVANGESGTDRNHYSRPLGDNTRMDRFTGSSSGRLISESSSGGNSASDHSIDLISHGCCWMQCVRTQELGITENFGAFQEIVGPGLYCMVWPFNSIAGRLSLRIQQIDVKCETKTKDNVFVQIMVSVFVRVIVPRAYDAYYRLTDPFGQIRSYVLDVVRSTVPRMSLDEAFSSTSDITDSVFCRLHQVMKEFGYEIVQTLVTDLRPNGQVRASMNAMKAARSMKAAMSNRAEIEKVKILRNAEAHAEELHLSGVGTANARMALAKGWSNCVQEWPKSHDYNVSEKEIMDLVLQVQYMDTLTAVGANSIILSTGIQDVMETRQDRRPDVKTTA